MTQHSETSTEIEITDWRASIPSIPLTPDEDREQFETVLQAVMQDLDPQGPYEYILAQNIFELEWERWRQSRWRESLLRSKSQFALVASLNNLVKSINYESECEQQGFPIIEGVGKDRARKFAEVEESVGQLASDWVHGPSGKVSYVRSIMQSIGLPEEEAISTAYSDNLPLLTHMERNIAQIEVRRRRLLADYHALQKSRKKPVEDAQFSDLD